MVTGAGPHQNPNESEVQPNLEDLTGVLDRLLTIPELAPLHDEVVHVRERLADGGAANELTGDMSPRLHRALRLLLGGRLDRRDHTSDSESPQSAIGDRPDDTDGLDAVSSPTALPTRDEMISAVLSASDRGTRDDAVTILFLADPQVSRAQDPHDNDNPRVAVMNEMNQVLNRLDEELWPTGKGLSPSIEGTPIGKSAGVFFGGDLCQTGGDYNGWDQAASVPPYYDGGFELKMVRRLFDPSYNTDGLTKLSVGPVFFGLGNHDVQSAYHPPVGWFKGCLRWSTPTDYWRWQMWNFICQMHRGVFTNCVFNWSTDPAAGTPSSMDAKESTSNSVFYWAERSLNYRVSLGPCDVYQLHVFGGDAQYGRASGISWLKDQLAERGTTRPVIIVQHYDFGSFSIPNWWTEDQRDELLGLLEPYNVVAFLMGHNHGRLTTIPFAQPYPKSTKVADEFRPGSAGVHGNFAVLRVSGTSLDIMQGSGKGKTLTWYEGHSKTW